MINRMKPESLFFYVPSYCEIGSTFRRKKIRYIHHYFRLGIRLQYI